MKNNKQSFYFTLLILTVIACKTHQGNIERVSLDQEEWKDQILFANFKVYFDNDTKSFKADIVNFKRVQGKLKPETQEEKTASSGDLLFAFLDGEEKILKSRMIPDPLIKHVEYVDDQGKLAMKSIAQDSSIISIRTQIIPFSKFFSLERYISENSRILLLKENLSQYD